MWCTVGSRTTSLKITHVYMQNTISFWNVTTDKTMLYVSNSTTRHLRSDNCFMLWQIFVWLPMTNQKFPNIIIIIIILIILFISHYFTLILKFFYLSTFMFFTKWIEENPDPGTMRMWHSPSSLSFSVLSWSSSSCFFMKTDSSVKVMEMFSAAPASNEGKKYEYVGIKAIHVLFQESIVSKRLKKYISKQQIQ